MTLVDPSSGEVLSPAGATFSQLAATPGIITTVGHDLAKDEEFDDLCGVDLIITSLTVRKGNPRQDGNPWTSLFGGFMSIELITNPVQQLKVINRTRRAGGMSKIGSLDELAFEPGDALVVNDGSTGIYRQLTALLEQHGYIRLPVGPENGKRGMTRWDTVPEEWEILKGQPVEKDDEPFLGYATTFLMHCTRGIRVSRYANEWGDRVTRYISA